MIYIIGVDGGRSTGLAETAGGIRRMYLQDTPEVVLRELDDRLAWHKSDPTHTVLVAYEIFRQSGRNHLTVQPDAQETAIRVVDLAARYGYQSVGQGPAEAKRIASDDFLRQVGLWTLPREVGQQDANDVNDAMRHAVLAMARHYATLFDALSAAASGR